MISSKGLTRRGFIGTAVSVPIAAQIGHADTRAELAPEEVDLDISAQDGLLTIAINEGIRRGRNAFWRDLGIELVPPKPEEGSSEAVLPQKWQIELARFGPNARVRFRNERSGPQNLRRYTVSVENVRYGRMARRRVYFVLQEHLVPDESGAAVYSQINAEKLSPRQRKIFEKTTIEDVPKVRAFTIEVLTNVWSRSYRPTATAAFAMQPQAGLGDAHIIDGKMRMRSWINKAAVMSQYIDAGRATASLALMFNGQVGFPAAATKANVLLNFDQSAAWNIEGGKVKLTAMTPGLKLDNIWVRWRKSAGEEAVPMIAPPKVEVDLIGPLPAVETVDVSGPAAAAEQFELFAQSAVTPEIDQDPGSNLVLSIPHRNSAPGLEVTLDRPRDTAKAAPFDRVVQFRMLNAADVEDGSLRRGRTRAEASLLTNWSRLNLTGHKQAASGPFKQMRGRFLERVEAPDRLNDFDYAECAGSLSFGANFTGPASRHWRVETPVGPIGFRGFALSDDKDKKDDAEPDLENPFQERFGDQVQTVLAWGNDRTRGFIERDRPHMEWLEINGVLREAAVQMPDAEHNRLTFASTHLTFLYTPGDLSPPTTSYIRLAPPESAVENAQLDLSRATLLASRSHDLLGLTFRFADFALSFQRGETELVRRNKSCLLTTDLQHDGSYQFRDTRPLLVVEFPGQHLFEEAYFLPKPPPVPDAEIRPAGTSELDGKTAAIEVNSQGNLVPHCVDGEVTSNLVVLSSTKVFFQKTSRQTWKLDPNDRAQVTALLGALPDVASRANIRRALKDQKSSLSAAFRLLAEKYAKAVSDRDLPDDQKEFIGPFALDPDAMQLAAQLWHEQRKEQNSWASALLKKVQAQSKVEFYGAKSRSGPEDRLIAAADKTFEGALALEARLEAMFPTYQLFRTHYREHVLDKANEPSNTNGQPNELSPQALEYTNVFHLIKGNPAPQWMVNAGLNVAQLKNAHENALESFAKVLAGEDKMDMPARARLANPSRLAFRVRCRDGTTVARNKVEGLDVPPDARALEAREELEFTLASLTRFSDFDLSVVKRAQAVYRPSETGRVDALSRRRLDLSPGGRLDHLGFSSGPFVNAERRLNEIAQSLRDPPGSLETAIEIPARLTLSPDQNAVVIAPFGQVPPGVLDETIGAADMQRPQPIRLWSADFMVDDVDPNLRAVHSPDLRPDFVEARLRSALIPDGHAKGKRYPGASAPLRGPFAPWHLGPADTQTQSLTPADIPEKTAQPGQEENAPNDFNRAYKRMFDLLASEGKRKAKISTRDWRFRSALDAYDRHELVLLSSAWGLPAMGRRSQFNELVADSSQAEVEPRHRLADVEHGSALYIPRTLATTELSLTPIGGTFRHSSSFEPPAAAFDSHGRPLYDALSVESWQQWTNLGRDIFCEIVYKGFLWPIGQRASLVRVTEREFFIDAYGAIRAALRQRLFIRVGKAEKLYPALKQPSQGRRFPVDRLKNLTTQTPDIVDPNQDEIIREDAHVLPGGRVALGQSAKGLVFWPRTARLQAANLRFELDLDGTLTDLPLIFVDNVAANDPRTLQKLAIYYNKLPTPDPLSATKAQGALDPINHVRTLNMGGVKRRYAPEKEAGSASCETQHWTLCATGLEAKPMASSGKDTQARAFATDDTSFRSDPLLQGADQPPFYPALESCRIRPRQAERLTGAPLKADNTTLIEDPRFLRAVPDGHFIKFGLPATTSLPDAKVLAGSGNETETYMAMIDQLQLSMGDKGDQAGGVFRPSGRVIGLSRSRGIQTWGTNVGVSELDCSNILSVAGLYSIASTEANKQKSVPSDAEKASICSEAEPVVIDPKIKTVLDDAQKLYSDVVDGNAKILGLVSIKDLFKFIDNLDPPSTGMPELAEQAQYGANQIKATQQDIADGVEDALSAVNEAADLARQNVILPLSEVVRDVRAGWDELDKEIATLAKRAPANLVKAVNFAKVFPDLHCTLVAFEGSLNRCVATADAFAFTLAVSEVYSAGKRFLDALFRAASDPGPRLQSAVASSFGGILDLADNLDELVPILLREQIERLLPKTFDDKELYDELLKIAQFAQTADDEAKPPPAVVRRVSKALSKLLTIDADQRFLTLPPRPEAWPEADWETIDIEQEEAEQIFQAVLTHIINNRGDFDLDQLLNVEVDGKDLRNFVGDAVQKRINDLRDKAFSDAQKASLDDLEKIAKGAEAEAAIQLNAWVRSSFGSDLETLFEAERLIKGIVLAIEEKQPYLVLKQSRELLELFFGPLGALDQACAALTKPLKKLAKALRIEEDGIYAQIKSALETATTKWTTLSAEVTAKRAELDAHVKTLVEKKPAKPPELVNLWDAAKGKAVELQMAFVDVEALFGDVSGLLGGAKTDLTLDETLAADAWVALNTLANGECKLDEFTKLPETLKALMDGRVRVLKRVTVRIKGIADAIDKIMSHKVVREVALAGAVIGAANALLDLKGLAQAQKEEVDALATKVKTTAQSVLGLRKSIGKQLAARLAELTGGVHGVLHKLKENFEHALKTVDQGDEAGLIDEIEQLTGHPIRGQIQASVDELQEFLDLLAYAQEQLVEISEIPDDDPRDPVIQLRNLKLRGIGSQSIGVLDLFKEDRPNRLPTAATFEARIQASLQSLEDYAAKIFVKVREGLATKANDLVPIIVNASVDDFSLKSLYAQLLDTRDGLYDDMNKAIPNSGTITLLPPTARAEIKDYTPYVVGEVLDDKNDQLAGDNAWLDALASDAKLFGAQKTPGAREFVDAFLSEWANVEPTPILIFKKLEDVFAEILRGDLLAAIDFNDIRKQIEDYILGLIPTKIDMSYAYGVELGDKVRSATGGIFAPGPGSKLTMEAGVSIDLGISKSSVQAKTVGKLGPFDVKLVGDAFDALTLRFNGAEFRAETGKKMEFDIAYSDYVIGPLLEFVQEFQSFLSPKGNSGFFLDPIFQPSFGIEAGYILNLGDFSVGAMAISNVGLATSAILPFEDADARFKASLSTRTSPFTITYTPYGGSGFFAIEANANGILGFEASFEFGGSAVFAFGPLSGKGRLMAGFYIRQSVGDNGQKLTELSATFFVGGTAQIWIFSFAASLSVRLGMVNGDMSGEAVFSFSFSMGLADFEYSVVLFKQESKGFNGQQASLRDDRFNDLGVRFANLDFTADAPNKLSKSTPRIDTDTVCQGRNWRRYRRYFTDEIAGDEWNDL